jgi:hypothetical protein
VTRARQGWQVQDIRLKGLGKQEIRREYMETALWHGSKAIGVKLTIHLYVGLKLRMHQALLQLFCTFL